MQSKIWETLAPASVFLKSSQMILYAAEFENHWYLESKTCVCFTFQTVLSKTVVLTATLAMCDWGPEGLFSLCSYYVQDPEGFKCIFSFHFQATTMRPVAANWYCTAQSWNSLSLTSFYLFYIMHIFSSIINKGMGISLYFPSELLKCILSSHNHWGNKSPGFMGLLSRRRRKWQTYRLLATSSRWWRLPSVGHLSTPLFTHILLSLATPLEVSVSFILILQIRNSPGYLRYLPGSQHEWKCWYSNPRTPELRALVFNHTLLLPWVPFDTPGHLHDPEILVFTQILTI